MREEILDSSAPSTEAISLREKLKSQIKRDFPFALFYLGPALHPESFDYLAHAKRLELEDYRAREYKNLLLKCKLWTASEDGRITLAEDFLELGDLSVLEHITMTMNLVSRLSESGPCWYESLYVTTTDELKKEFLRAINRVIRDFVEKSAKAKAPTTVLAWSHSSLDCREPLGEKK